MRRRILKTLAIALTAMALPAAVIAAGTAYKPEYKLSTVLGPAFPWGKGGEIWAELVRERSKGRINIKMYPGASLVGGDQTRELAAVRQGAIDLAIGSTINWSPQVKELNLYALPFLTQDHAGLDALTSGEVAKGHLRTGREGRRRAAGLGRERIPRTQQLEARNPQAGRHEGAQVPRRRLADLQ
jgi:TRAP-type C4-dicarboxylate transport system substrate-binding protein